MRAKNYRNFRMAYAPWSATQMLRAALIERMSYFTSRTEDKEFIAERAVGLELLKKYTLDELGRDITACFKIMKNEGLEAGQIERVKTLLGRLSNSDSWCRFDYDELRARGVLVRFTGTDIDELAKTMKTTPESRVVEARDFPKDPEIDWEKKIPQQYKLLINGRATIKQFARDTGLLLPPEYVRGEVERNQIVDRALRHGGFHFHSALESTVHYAQQRVKRPIAVFVIKTSRGIEVRYCPYDHLVGHELVVETQQGGINRSIHVEHGDEEETPVGYESLNVHIPLRGCYS